MEAKKIFRQDYGQTKSLVKAGRISSENAVRRSKALDLTVTYIENNIVYNELPDGTKIEVGVVERKEPAFVITKGMVLRGK